LLLRIYKKESGITTVTYADALDQALCFGWIDGQKEFLDALARNKKAATFYKTLNKTNLYSIAHRLQTAKRPETKQKRIASIIEMLARRETFR